MMAVGINSCTDVKTTSKGYTLVEEGTKPFDYKVYELKNGLKVHLSKNSEKPRIQTYIGVKVGSKNDPSTHTGLAHYLEHMLFKGTSKLGTDQWEKEKPLIDKIKQTYEVYGVTTSEEERKKIYAKIDSLSYLASTYAIANEYDKIISEIGGQGTNAYTSMDQTVYLTDIPSSSLDKWLQIEKERFGELVLRIFHTELEAVYEEFNIGQESDDEKVSNYILKSLFPNHTYGTQTTIGKAEHLKNPSMVEIEKFFNKYYVPNNMVMTLSGDINYEEAINKIEKTFGKLKKKELKKDQLIADEVKEVQRTTISGKESSYINIAYRLPGTDDRDFIKGEVVDAMLNNGFAGLLDLNLLKKQKVQDAYSYMWANKDYSVMFLAGYNKNGQSLEETEALLSQQIEDLKNGNFPDWLPQAAWNYLHKENLESMSQNSFRANELLYAGIYEYPVAEYLTRMEKVKNISKSDVQEFVKKHFNQQSAIVHKTQGQGTSVKVKAPKITPVKLRRNVHSAFYDQITKQKDLETTPVFTDFEAELNKNSNKPFYAIENTENDLFKLYFILPFGSFDDPLGSLALAYSKYLDTDSLTAEEINQQMFKNGLTWDVRSTPKEMRIELSGLKENMQIGIDLLQTIFSNPKSNDAYFKELISSKTKVIEDAYFKPDYILWNALLGKVKFGNGNPLIHALTKAELQTIKEKNVIQKLKNMFNQVDRVFYFGPKDIKQVEESLAFVWKSKQREHTEVALEENFLNKSAHFVNHDMVQSQLLMVAKKGDIKEENAGFNMLFKGYFGTLAFRELRESKALAYTSYITFREPTRKAESDYVMAFIGCQVDKFPMALEATESLLKTTPSDKRLFEETKVNVLKSLKSMRIVKDQIFWSWKALQQKEYSNDYYKNLKNQVEALTFEDFQNTFNSQIKNLNYSLLVIGNKKDIDMETIKNYGPFTEYSKETILP
jgi:predicted Zn-dependent peptidase